MDQRIPAYRAADLKRVLEREFPGEVGNEALRVLRIFGEDQWRSWSPRIHMACLKLANGDIENLRKYVRAACGDPRDVIAWAEYVRYMKAKDTAAQQEAIEEDWRELQEWLARK